MAGFPFLRWAAALALGIVTPGPAFSATADRVCLRALQRDGLAVSAFSAAALELADWWELEGKATARRNREVRYPIALVRGHLVDMRQRAGALQPPNPEVGAARATVVEALSHLASLPEVSEEALTNAVLGYACLAERMERGRWPWGPIVSAGESTIVFWRDSKWRRGSRPDRPAPERPESALYWEGPDGASPLEPPRRLERSADPGATSPLFFWPRPLSDRDFNFASSLDVALVEIAHVGREADNQFMYAYRFVEHDLGHAADVRRFLDTDSALAGSRKAALLGRMRVTDALFRGAMPPGLTLDRAHRAYFSWHHEPFRLSEYDSIPEKRPYAQWIRSTLAGP